MPLRNFRKETKDSIEYLYKDRILLNFPLYAKFWEENIGFRDRAEWLLPYKFRYTKSISAQEKRHIYNNFLQLCMTHYSLFCHLAGAHFQIRQMFTSLKIKNPGIRHFRHFESFECCYLHIGIVYNQIYNMWYYFMKMQGININQKNLKKSVHAIMRKNKRQYLIKEITILYRNAIILRNNIAHCTRIPTLKLQTGQYAIPLRLKNTIWTKQIRAKRLQLTTARALSDLDHLEVLSNKFEEILLKKFRDWKITKGVNCYI